MSELHPHADRPSTLTPRQDRIEESLIRLLSLQSTRSQVREVVYELADLHRLQGLSADRAIGQLKSVVQRGLFASARRSDLTAGIATETMAMVVRWYQQRFTRTTAGAPLADARVADWQGAVLD